MVHDILCPSPKPGKLNITTATNDKMNKHLSHRDIKKDGHRDCHQNESKLCHVCEHFHNHMTSKDALEEATHSLQWATCSELVSCKEFCLLWYEDATWLLVKTDALEEHIASSLRRKDS
jgi:hypothetical protein